MLMTDQKFGLLATFCQLNIGKLFMYGLDINQEQNILKHLPWIFNFICYLVLCSFCKGEWGLNDLYNQHLAVTRYVYFLPNFDSEAADVMFSVDFKGVFVCWFAVLVRQMV